MGRPLKKQYFGNVNSSGQTIIGNAWVNGDTVARPSWIYKQLGTGLYYWFSTNGKGPATGGQAYLVNGACTGPGQANIAIYPFGTEGGGATVGTVRMGAHNASTTANGDGVTGHNYTVGQWMAVQGGTTNAGAANIQISATTWSAVGLANKGSGYAVDEQLTFSFAGWATPAVVQVNTVNGTGAIQTVTVKNPGVYTATTYPGGPYAASSSNTIAGVNATFNVQYGVYSFGTVGNTGAYSALPANPVSFTYSGSDNGAGATANIYWDVKTVPVTNGGSGFDPANPDTAKITFSTGSATAVGVINAAGSVTSVTITNGGATYTTIPTVTIGPQSGVTLAQNIFDNTVQNWSGQTWSWLPNGNTLPGPTWAHVNTQ